MNNQLIDWLAIEDGGRVGGVDTYIDEFGIVPLPQIVEDGGVVEEGEIGHVLAFLVLGWIHLSHQILLVGLFLVFG